LDSLGGFQGPEIFLSGDLFHRNLKLIFIVRACRELQKRNQQAHHEWAKAHQQELQQIKVIVSQSTETIMCSARFEDPEKQLLTAVEITPPAIESKALSTNESGIEFQKFHRAAKRQLKLKARFQTPTWLFGVSRAIELYECRMHAGWNFNIQVYNVVPYDSQIFEMARSGDVIGIQDLFRTGQASPFNQDPHGFTVLDVSCCHIDQSWKMTLLTLHR
jgi:hypothetical protein